MITHLASIPSPPQGVWEIGPLPLRAYALCIIAGIIVGVMWGNRRWVARGGAPGKVTDIAVFAVPFGIVGGRLYHVITDNQLYFGEGRNPWRAFAVWEGGLGVWGAIALGGLGAWIGCRYYKVSFAAFADAIAPGIAVAQGIGRLGNYFNQEVFGAATDVPWALTVYLRTPGGISAEAAGMTCGPGTPEFSPDYIKAVPEVVCGTYHPTFLYEMLWVFGVAALVVWADRKFRLGGGRAFWLYVAGYTLGRGWIEMLRIDSANRFLGLRINVFTSILLFLFAVVMLYVLRHKKREDPAQLRGRGDDPVDEEAAASDDAADGSATAVAGETDVQDEAAVSTEENADPVDLDKAPDGTTTRSGDTT